MIFILEAFFSGCISKVINDGKDYSWSKIKSVINDRHDHNISTKKCRVIEKALNIVTGNTYKNSDDLYIAIEKIFSEFKNHGDTFESVKSGLNVLGADACNQSCENFLEKFHEGIRRDDDLYKTIMMDLEQKGIIINQEGFQKIDEKIDNLTQIVSRENDNKINVQKRELIKSRTQEYADKWNQNMFLNNFDKRDENAGINVKLSEVYLEEHLPHYIWYKNSENNPSTDLKELLSEYIYEKDENKMLLILGQPGIGKSTLITWITANFTDKADDILVYRFASDLRDFDWQSARLLNKILEKIGFDCKDLNRKTIILDGLDEVSINNRREVLDGLYDNLIYGNCIKEFSLIITCRENYVQEKDRIKGKYIILQTWDEAQIRSFCDVFQEKTKINISENTLKKIIESKDILGIPLILYMVLALNISIEKEGSIVGVYDKIFALDGGIYDRCINNKNFADKHRIAEIKGQIHQISRDIAIWMFENNSEKAYIPKGMYQKICDNAMQKQEQKNEDIQHDFLIGNYFKLVKHCEGIETEQLYFVHRTIYEYFVAETIFSSIEKNVKGDEENLAGDLGRLLKGNKLSKEILGFLKNKIKIGSLNNAFDKINQTFQVMIHNGMTYYTKECYKNVIECEMQVFVNMLEIIHLWENINIFLIEEMINYLNPTKKRSINKMSNPYRFLKCEAVNLKGAILKDASESFEGIKLLKSDLHEANLHDGIFRRANLIGANLTGANLRNVDFENAALDLADLRGADMKGINLQGATLKDTLFDEKQIIELRKYKYDLQDVRVFIEKEDCRISYRDYCKRK